MKNIGIALIGLGIITLIYSSFNFTTQEKLVDFGPIKIDKEKKHAISWPPITGIVFLLCGAGLILFERNSKR